MNITRATVLTGQGTDRVFLLTDLPGAFTVYSEPLWLKFEATKGTGEAYVRKHFNIEPTIIDRSDKLEPFKRED